MPRSPVRVRNTDAPEYNSGGASNARVDSNAFRSNLSDSSAAIHGIARVAKITANDIRQDEVRRDNELKQTQEISRRTHYLETSQALADKNAELREAHPNDPVAYAQGFDAYSEELLDNLPDSYTNDDIGKLAKTELGVMIGKQKRTSLNAITKVYEAQEEGRNRAIELKRYDSLREDNRNLYRQAGQETNAADMRDELDQIRSNDIEFEAFINRKDKYGNDIYTPEQKAKLIENKNIEDGTSQIIGMIQAGANPEEIIKKLDTDDIAFNVLGDDGVITGYGYRTYFQDPDVIEAIKANVNAYRKEYNQAQDIILGRKLANGELSYNSSDPNQKKALNDYVKYSGVDDWKNKNQSERIDTGLLLIKNTGGLHDYQVREQNIQAIGNANEEALDTNYLILSEAKDEGYPSVEVFGSKQDTFYEIYGYFREAGDSSTDSYDKARQYTDIENQDPELFKQRLREVNSVYKPVGELAPSSSKRGTVNIDSKLKPKYDNETPAGRNANAVIHARRKYQKSVFSVFYAINGDEDLAMEMSKAYGERVFGTSDITGTKLPMQSPPDMDPASIIYNKDDLDFDVQLKAHVNEMAPKFVDSSLLPDDIMNYISVREDELASLVTLNAIKQRSYRVYLEIPGVFNGDITNEEIDLNKGLVFSLDTAIAKNNERVERQREEKSNAILATDDYAAMEDERLLNQILENRGFGIYGTGGN